MFTSNKYLGVSLETFTNMIEGPRKPRFRIRRYEAANKILIITIPTKAHERLHLGLYTKTQSRIDEKGLEDQWIAIGSATFRPLGHPDGDGGEADSSGGPYPQRGGREDWPTLIIEAGDSETLPDLHKDMKWWFSASDHQVKIVILAKIERSQGRIIVEKWIEVPAPPRQGATTTRAAAAAPAPMLQPVLDQVIDINGIGSPPVYTVTRALCLDFHLLFPRQPSLGEGDVTIGIPDLQDYGRRVWAVA